MRIGLQPRAVWGLVISAVVVVAIALAPPTPGEAVNLPSIAPHDHKGYVEPIPGSEIKFAMVPIPGGTFLMGSPPSEPGRSADEGPQHPVTLRPFWMGKLEVTWEEYDLFWKDRPGNKDEQMEAERANLQGQAFDALSRPTPPYADETFGHGRDERPALSITVHGAMEYCRWLSSKTGKAYRLPTEAEWEWACRAGTRTAYSFGDDPKQLGAHAWFADNAEDTVHVGGKKKPNGWGLHDMEGNVAEWCLDQYTKDSYARYPTDRPVLAPVILPGPDRFTHAVRGGSWADKADRLRCAARRGSDKTWIRQDPQRPRSIWWLTDADFVGFRVVRALQEQDNLKGLRSQIRWTSN